MRKFEILLLVFLVTLFVGLTVVAVQWRTRPVYDNAYKNKIEAAREYRESLPEGSATGQTRKEEEEPYPYGLREREIKKNEGDRFRTF